MEKTETLTDFYNNKLNWMPENLGKEMGHFNIFRLDDFVCGYTQTIPYSRKDFFKISFIVGKNEVHYADRSVLIEKQALFFANPQVPYNWEYLQEEQSGFFCIFTETFFSQFGAIKEYPVFKPGGTPIFHIDDEQAETVRAIFLKMTAEIESEYTYKYDVIRTLVFELIHLALKLEPMRLAESAHNGTARVASYFTELLERQFPIESPLQRMKLRTPNAFADHLSVHVNYLNRSLKETLGKTTSQLIGERIVREAQALLKHTDWNVAEIGYCLGFEEPANFNAFFRKHASLTPRSFRNLV